ncbi:4Fe-4S binding protein [Methylobacillus sp. MM3]|nr:4Fe-4S binding protein [Methylobacillus sp. MM3]
MVQRLHENGPDRPSRAMTQVFAVLLFGFALFLSGLALADSDEGDKPEHHETRHAGSYEAPLPVELSTDPDLCAYAPCEDAFPGAESFSLRKGRPSYVEAYADDDGKKLLGYVFLSTDIVDIPAYSGKPVVTLIGMDTLGKIVGIRILKHSEPILLVGIPERELTKFIKQFLGKNAADKIEIGKARAEGGYIGIDAISGATVTVIAENQVVMRSALEVAKQVGIIKSKPRPQADFTPATGKKSWDALLDEGSLQRLTISAEDVGIEGNGQPYLDAYFGYLNAPDIGRSILGDRVYERLMGELKPNEHAIFIVANGSASFKGSGFVRGGIYDRVQVSQDMDTFTFRDTDYLNLYNVEAAGAPSYNESAIFIIRSPSFSAAYPWSLVFLGNKIDKQTGNKTFANFDHEYWTPEHMLQGGRPEVIKPDPTWLKIWKDKKVGIVLFTLLLVITALVHVFRDHLVRRANHKDKRWVSIPKYAIWIISIGVLGFGLMAQPSVTHILTWVHSLLFQWKWELFLSDPYIFVFWWFIIITVFIWGRGLFCGWLCPYGSMSELLYKITSATPLRRFQFMLPKTLHDKLKWLKYAIFLTLLATSFYSMGIAEKMAEVEPFKTTFLVGVWNRSWPFVAFWLALFGLSMFTERPFCKYLCPLGAGLAIPSQFRGIALKRKSECTSCHACAAGCGSLAIDEKGKIDQRECLLCLDCMVMYYDDHACPPLSKERKQRAKNGLPLTPINAQGYFIPVESIGRPPKKEAKPA